MRTRDARTGRAAVRLFARAEARRHWTSLVALALIVAFVSAGVLGATAGARRTASVLDRFLAWSQAPDAAIGAAWPLLANDRAAVEAQSAALAAQPGVEAIRTEIGYVLFVSTKYDFMLSAPISRDAPDIGRPMLLDGRWPDPTAADEITINDVAATELQLGPGDTLVAPVVRAETWDLVYRGTGNELEAGLAEGHRLDLRVVGITRDEASLAAGQSESPSARGTPAFVGAYPEAGAVAALHRVLVDRSSYSRDATHRFVTEDMDGNGDVWHEESEDRGPTRTGFRWIAAGLAIFAAVALVAGLLAVVQATTRQVQLSRNSVGVGTALGMSRTARTIASSVPAALAIVVGVTLGTTVAVASSSRFPISVARRAEIAPGIRVDAPVHLGGAVALAAVMLLATVLVAARNARPRRDAATPRASRWAALHTRLRPPAAYGASTVLDRAASRRTGVRPWTALLGTVVALTGVTAILVFESSRTEAGSDPARYGWTWDLMPDVGAGGDAEDGLAVVQELAADSRVESVGGLFCSSQLLAAQLTPRCTIFTASGTIEPTALAGRAPSSPTEAMLGRLTAERLGLSIGDQVTLDGPDGTGIPFTVVGIAAVPTVSDNDSPGVGVMVAPEGLETLIGASVFEADDPHLVMKVTEGLDVERVTQELAAEYPLAFPIYAYPEPPELVQQLHRLRPSFAALALFLGALGSLGLIHFLALSTRRRRGDFAVMQAIGFVRRQVAASVVWQATTIALIGVLVGVPLGIIIGRVAWTRAIRSLGMDAGTTLPVVAVAVIVGGTLIGSAAVAIVPGWVASRTRPAAALRSE